MPRSRRLVGLEPACVGSQFRLLLNQPPWEKNPLARICGHDSEAGIAMIERSWHNTVGWNFDPAPAVISALRSSLIIAAFFFECEGIVAQMIAAGGNMSSEYAIRSCCAGVPLKFGGTLA